MTYDEMTERVEEIGDAFRTYSALLGCSMFYVIAMILDRLTATWPDLQSLVLGTLPWGVVLGVLCLAFEALRRRTAAQLHASLRAWYLRGPGAGGARVIEARPLSITYEYFGRKKRAAIAFFWSRIEVETHFFDRVERTGA